MAACLAQVRLPKLQKMLLDRKQVVTPAVVAFGSVRTHCWAKQGSKQADIAVALESKGASAVAKDDCKLQPHLVDSGKRRH